jgi:hypothetical protein
MQCRPYGNPRGSARASASSSSVGCSARVSECDRGLGENQTLCPMRHVGALIARRRRASRRPTRCPPTAASTAFSPGFNCAGGPGHGRCPGGERERLPGLVADSRSSWCVEPGVRPSTGRERFVSTSQAPGARYSTERFTARSTSSGVNSTTVLVATAPDEFTAIAIAAALSLSGKSAIT